MVHFKENTFVIELPTQNAGYEELYTLQKSLIKLMAYRDYRLQDEHGDFLEMFHTLDLLENTLLTPEQMQGFTIKS